MSESDFFPNPEFVPELLELLDEGVVFHASDGSVTACNEAAARMLGVSSVGLAGRLGLFTSLEATGEGAQPLSTDDEPAMQSLRTGAVSKAVRIRIRRADGEVVWLQVKAVPLLSSRRPALGIGTAIHGALTVLRDLSDQVLIEQRLRGHVPEDAFGHLAGSVAHDFNHFLTVIVGYNALIEQQLAPGDPLREHAEHTRIAANGATMLVRELVDFSRRQRSSDGVMDLKLTVTEMRPMLARLLGPRIRLKLDLERESGWVRANPAQLERAIFNLALNSRDAMRDGGELCLSTRHVVIDTEFTNRHPGSQIGEFVRLTVADTGAGMDAGTRERVFEPFFTTKPAGQGTGLGLATVWGIVKQFGGYIEVESEPGRGAEFRIDLPAHGQLSADGSATPARSLPG